MLEISDSFMPAGDLSSSSSSGCVCVCVCVCMYVCVCEGRREKGKKVEGSEEQRSSEDNNPLNVPR